MSAGEVRAFLERHGLLARRDLGQNFLCDASLAERLVTLAGVEADDSVIEIGTGLGVLTRALAARCRRVVSIEIDAGIVRALAAEEALPANVELRHADVLRLDWQELISDVAPPRRLVTNLPYSISGPVLRRILDLRQELEDWSVMLQREVAARLLARRGSRDYGSLSVLHALCVTVSREMTLAPGCFFPAPKVRSAFLRIRPRADSPLAGDELTRVERVVRAGFSTRRKMLGNSLSAAGWAAGPALQAAFEAAGIDPRKRAQELEPEDFLALARGLPEGPGAGA